MEPPGEIVITCGPSILYAYIVQVDHQLMCLSSLDVTGDGVPEVVSCSWDGQTYIISQDRQAVR